MEEEKHFTTAVTTGRLGLTEPSWTGQSGCSLSALRAQWKHDLLRTRKVVLHRITDTICREETHSHHIHNHSKAEIDRLMIDRLMIDR